MIVSVTIMYTPFPLSFHNSVHLSDVGLFVNGARSTNKFRRIHFIFCVCV